MAKKSEEAATSATEMPAVQLLANYIRDVSFENIALQNNYSLTQAPSFEMNMNVGNRKLVDDIYEVHLNLKIKSVEGEHTIFILDLDHAGRFRLVNADEKTLVPLLFIECPRLLFPYTRRIVSTMTLDGGMPPLNLDNVDFVEMFKNSVEQAREFQESQKAKDSN